MASSAHSSAAFAAADQAAPWSSRAQEGHEGADVPSFGEIYDTYFAFVWQTARRLGAPPNALDDVVQEVFMVVHRRRAECPAGARLRGWLYGVILNVTRAHRRAARKTSVEVPRSGTEDDVDRTTAHPGLRPDESTARAEARGALETILSALDEDKLEVFVLAELEQLTVREIAEILGINPNTASARLRAARQTFSEAIARHQARDAWRLR